MVDLEAVDFVAVEAAFFAGAFLAGAFFAGAFLAGAFFAAVEVFASAFAATDWMLSEASNAASLTSSAASCAAFDTLLAPRTPSERVWRETVPRVSSPASMPSLMRSSALETASPARFSPASSCGLSLRRRVTTSSPRVARPE